MVLHTMVQGLLREWMGLQQTLQHDSTTTALEHYV
jgi:hypothetical protein